MNYQILTLSPTLFLTLAQSLLPYSFMQPQFIATQILMLSSDQYNLFWAVFSFKTKPANKLFQGLFRECGRSRCSLRQVIVNCCFCVNSIETNSQRQIITIQILYKQLQSNINNITLIYHFNNYQNLCVTKTIYVQKAYYSLNSIVQSLNILQLTDAIQELRGLQADTTVLPKHTYISYLQ
ncbi:Hypothetical_protein [Hexamita inflata]|uniref:Hypothetical_protein n=1 Tax=Hexamita inflata TaxID=28002 RepID=A0AA86PWG3_9EUKA|nr:Hypothetical protein HINF_LOCUS33928 [Hexamita inflata]